VIPGILNTGVVS